MAMIPDSVFSVGLVDAPIPVDLFQPYILTSTENIRVVESFTNVANLSSFNLMPVLLRAIQELLIQSMNQTAHPNNYKVNFITDYIPLAYNYV